MTIAHSHFESLPQNPKVPGRRKSSCAEVQCFQNYYHGHQLLSPNPHYIGNVRASVNHWQLRDLVQIDPLTGSVFHSYRDLIRVLSVKNHDLNSVKSRTYLQLPYFARCFNHAPGGLFVTGGLDNSLAKLAHMDIPALSESGTKGNRRKPDGLFSVYSPAMATEMTFHLGEMINNAVTIYPDQDLTASYTSYVCNNDSNLYVVGISDLGVLVKRNIVCQAKVSLNNVIQSPNQKFLAATGDSGLIFLLDPTKPRATFQTIKTDHDSGFGLSFHSNEHTLASAFQNGSCLLFDLRKPNHAYHEIKSTRPNHQSGAFRCCKFLNSPTQDLLAVLEHVGRVHIIDLRNLSDNHQVVVFPLALDQFSRYNYQKSRICKKLKSKSDVDDLESNDINDANDTCTSDVSTIDDDYDRPDRLIHPRWEIFGDANTQFSAPLVYDHDYLTNENPKLFKGYEYEPPSPASVFDETNGSLDSKPSTSHREEASTQETVLETTLNSTEAQNFRRIFHDLYMQAGNHVNGEMQLSGIDWYDNQLFIGSEDGGFCEWDVNVRGRRSFGSFSFA
ncbi:hypothetical protein PUMCH_004628 [Australozyma saopauloensis]|uniref:DUF2415 domain-containing protein n=1 Tax=Australozyma saopauloensis TaxID=291208 RepID=A0AAX4HFC7_9ASCO|nr:hypothetical protein PUMCH_004628 [[Candida] saopauloensis]